MTSRRPLLGIALGAVATSGCFRYVAIEPAAVRPNEEVRVGLSPAAGARISKEVGAFTTEIDGQLAPQGADSLSVSVMIQREYRGTSLESARQSLYFGRSEIVTVKRRQFSTRRTVLASIGTLAGFAALTFTISQLTNANPDESQPLPPPPPPTGARAARAGISLLRIPIR